MLNFVSCGDAEGSITWPRRLCDLTGTRHLVVLISQTAQGSSILPLFGHWRPVINLQSGKFWFFAHIHFQLQLWDKHMMHLEASFTEEANPSVFTLGMSRRCAALTERSCFECPHWFIFSIHCPVHCVDNIRTAGREKHILTSETLGDWRGGDSTCAE